MTEIKPGTALRLLVVADGMVAGRVFKDAPPESPTWPYVTFLDPVTLTDGLRGDRRALTRARVSQWDLWQHRRDEDPDLPERLAGIFNGAVLDLGDARSWGCRVTQTARVPDPDTLVVHHSLTVSLQHP